MYCDIRIKATKYLGLDVWYTAVYNKYEFQIALKNIIEETKLGIKPLIHLEMHGSSDHNGLVLRSQECLLWGELLKYLRNINAKTNNNLFLVLACCHGADLLRGIDFSMKSPFYAYLGSFEEVYPDQLLKFTEFYDEVLETGNLSIAINILNQVFTENELVYFKANNIFDFLWKQIDEEHNDPIKFNEKVNLELVKCLSMPRLVENYSILHLRANIAISLKESYKGLKFQMQNQFFYS